MKQGFSTSLPAIPFFGFQLLDTTTQQFIEHVTETARARESPCRIGYLNAATVNLAFDSPPFAETIRRFELLYADGLSVVLASQRFGRRIPERINAGDFIEEFFRRCAEKDLKVGLLGGKTGEAQRFGQHFKSKIPGLQIVFDRNGYFASEDAHRIAGDIDQADPDIVLIGMGSPRQEAFALERSQHGKPRVWWCVGALFEYSSGTRPRAPGWMRRVGLEWLFRLVLEPRRLWKRYLIGNPKFVYRVLRGAPVPSRAFAGD